MNFSIFRTKVAALLLEKFHAQSQENSVEAFLVMWRSHSLILETKDQQNQDYVLNTNDKLVQSEPLQWG